MSEYTPFDGGPQQGPIRMQRLETCWRVIGPSNKPIVCSLYRVASGIEARVEYGPDDLIQSKLASNVDDARDIAAAWKQAAVGKGFTELEKGH